MKKSWLKKTTAVVILALVLSSVFTVSAVNEVGSSVPAPELPYQSYTYWVDVNASEKVPVYSKPMYKADNFIPTGAVGGNDQSLLNDIVSQNGKTYLLDGGLGRVYVLDQSYAAVCTVQNVVRDNEVIDFSGAQGLYVDKSGLIYIADTENERVIVTDINSNCVKILELPDSPLIPTGFKYKPVKVVVDKKGYTYIVSEGSYYGAILYSPKTEFLGFFGANTVKGTLSTAYNNLFNRLFSNDVKRAADELSLPYTLTDITVGPDNFIYTATGRTAKSGTIQKGQVCVYNPGGKDTLKASSFNFADYEVAGAEKAQNILGIDVDDEGYIYLLDGVYGRIFFYDKECNLLSVFGGGYNDSHQTGGFYLPTAITVNGQDIVVTDRQKNGITIFKITQYGNLVKQADSVTLMGDFATALPLWKEVIRQDSNNQLAYRGVAKALYDIGEDEEAIKYSRMGYDRETYSKAFENIRNQWLEDNFTLIAIFAIILISAISALLVIKKKRNIIILKNDKAKILAMCTLHPVESFRAIKEKQKGSLISAVVLLAVFYVVTVLNDTAGGFIFTVFDYQGYNALYVFLSTVGLIILWTISNWLICSLMGGVGRIKEIFIVTCYCLIPIILGNILRLVLTHIIVADEAAFMGMMVFAVTAYAAFMLIIGIMRIHDYSFGKFVGTTVLSVIAMMIIIFLIFLIVMLAQQVYGWLLSVLIEIKSKF